MDLRTIQFLKHLCLTGSAIPKEVSGLVIPQLTAGISLDRVRFSVRTYNCLRRLGVNDLGIDLSGKVLGELLSVYGFGRKSLLEVLEFIEACSNDNDLSHNDKYLGQRYPLASERDHSMDVCQIELLIEILRKYRLPSRYSALRFTSLPQNLPLESLRLSNRTLRALRRAKFKMLSDLNGCSLRHLLSIEGFGTTCLYDLLTTTTPLIKTFAENDSLAQNIDDRSEIEQSEHAERQQLIFQRLRRLAMRLRRQRWASLLLTDDPRLGRELLTLDPHSNSLKELACRILEEKFDSRDAEMLIKSLRQLDKKVKTFRSLPLDEELKQISLAVTNERAFKLIAKRYGWDGGPGATLQETGESLGITRERVRQIEADFKKKLIPRTVFAPALERVLNVVQKQTFSSAETFEEFLLSKKLVSRRMSVQGVLNAADLFGRPISLSVVKVNQQSFIVEKDSMDLPVKISRQARKFIEHWGVATVEDVSATVSSMIGSEVPHSIALDILKSQQDIIWLDSDFNWFTLKSVPRNRLTNQITKILAVANPIDLRELREGIGRHHRMRGLAPPKRVLSRFCHALLNCTVENEIVSLTERLDWRNLRSNSEKILVETLLENGCAMSRIKLEELCVERGMSRSSFYSYLSFSPLIARYAPGVYGLRGADVSPPDIQRLIPKIERKHRVLLDHGWKDGKIWIEYCISESMLKSGVTTLPASIRKFVMGVFELYSDDGSEMGVLSTKGSSVWGLGPFFRRRGGEAGDHLLLVFDLKNHTAKVMLGDKSLSVAFRGNVE